MADRLTPRKKQALEMRRHIQKTALELFQREGFERVSIQDIARAAGCSVGNIYHYFKSKDELAIQVTDHVDAAYLAWAEEHRDYAGTALDKLLDFVADSLEISRREEVLYTSFVHGLKYPEQGILAFREDRVWFRVLRELVEGAKAQGAIPDRVPTGELVRELVILHRGVLFQWRIEGEGFPLAPTGRSMARRLLGGFPPQKSGL